MLEKYRGWIVGTILALGIRWYMLPQGYLELIEWLGPVMGEWTRPIIMIGIPIISNPLSDVFVLLVWVVPALIGGLLAGGGAGRGTFVSFAIGFSIMGVLAIGVYAILPNLLSDGFGLALLPPPGFDVFAVLQLPLATALSELATVAVSMVMGGGGTPDITELVNIFAQTLGVNIALNLVIALVSGAIGGAIGAKAGIGVKKEKKVTPMEQPGFDFSGGVDGAFHRPKRFRINVRNTKRALPFVLAIFLFGLLLTPKIVLPVSASSTPDSGFNPFQENLGDLFVNITGDVYGEANAWMLTDTGDVVMLGLAGGSEVGSGLDFDDPAFEDLMIMAVFAQGNISALGGILTSLFFAGENGTDVGVPGVGDIFGEGDTISQVLGLIPERGMILVYTNITEAVAQSRSTIAIGLLTSQLGLLFVGDPFFIYLEIPVGDNPEDVLPIAISAATISSSEETTLSTLLGTADDGVLDPVNPSVLMHSDIYVTGLVAGPIFNMVTQAIMPGLDFSSAGVLVTAAYWADQFKGTGTHTFDIEDYVTLTESLKPPTYGNVSAIMAMLPSDATVTNYTPMQPNVFYENESNMVVAVMQNSTHAINEFTVEFTYEFPPDVILERVFSPIGIKQTGEDITITLRVTNNADEPITSVGLWETPWYDAYTTANYLSGDLSGQWTSIGPGDSEEFSYIARVDAEGSYLLNTPLLEYLYNGTQYVEILPIGVLFATGNPQTLLMNALNDPRLQPIIAVVGVMIVLPPLIALIRRK